jgi:hypothetical protein
MFQTYLHTGKRGKVVKNNHRTGKRNGSGILGAGGKERKVWMGSRKGRKGLKDGDKNEIIFLKRPVLGMCYQFMTK